MNLILNFFLLYSAQHCITEAYLHKGAKKIQQLATSDTLASAMLAQIPAEGLI